MWIWEQLTIYIFGVVMIYMFGETISDSLAIFFLSGNCIYYDGFGDYRVCYGIDNIPNHWRYCKYACRCGSFMEIIQR